MKTILGSDLRFICVICGSSSSFSFDLSLSAVICGYSELFVREASHEPRPR
jgi:hypothetical protein